jgi:hypothetical protein
MTKIQILIAVISSSVIAAGLTSLVNILIHRSNYRNDYYKAVLTKRMDAYEVVNKIVSQMSNIITLGNWAIPQICESKKHYDDFCLALSLRNPLWLSDEMCDKLTEINVFLMNEIDNKIDRTISEVEQNQKFQNFGYLYFKEIRSYRTELTDLMNRDFRRLHKIKSFLKNSKKSKNTFGVEKREF